MTMLREVTDLDVFEGMTHHGDEHVDQHDDDGDVVQRKQEHSDSFHNRRRVVSTWKGVRVFVVLVLARIIAIYPPSTPFFSCLSHVLVLARVLDLDAVDADESEHGPEQTVERSWQSE